MTENKNTEAADSVNHETAHTSATPDRDQDQTESRDDEVIRSALKQLTPERIRSLISDKKVIQIAARLVSSTKTVHFRGPQPPPEMLQGYEDVQKGFAERLLSMAEREAAHRHTIETRLIEDDATKVKTWPVVRARDWRRGHYGRSDPWLAGVFLARRGGDLWNDGHVGRDFHFGASPAAERYVISGRDGPPS